MEDLHAVLDAAGSERTFLLGSHDGCSLAALYAATYPGRVRGLALFHPAAHQHHVWEQADELEQMLADLREGWGTQEFCDAMLEEICPTLLERARRTDSGSRTRSESAPPRPWPSPSTARGPRPTSAIFSRPSAYPRSSSAGRVSRRSTHARSPS